ncbi:MAG: hypothetical protein UV37_C0004G0047 [Candidatus Collierbacteria bacterium GW2011_GWA1_42_60]|uniref:Signal peptidase I n=1 Tax=Candidatus Collierbacteria bacterium GW2011_GWA2_42_17 TaxID=1618378 RepID=A0A0G1BAW4_9BACT|nr:MAG: hypothetical protein UU94_C0001G0004 [Candidatus Collierbacteria bacterium GW2011_GWB2_42_12]KKS43496.1 MAG: hypothetical protein UV06_C0001G0230 [Candidatus Collierbacteria bacterium GW2011_GWA2_42_17]KKS61628.1 MAG: hypothetical protein UV28_C0030G0004 [Candidatus Collierbacteria bacterium GW2011_GWE2_42_48]KKS62794.1 MAG: hypothetical protein UV29_C0010G0029 [Candidatus Collierbacteria bacterium GW2011_GWD2_42_50]KKS64761.1 MAG: hypothetical protein UV32_C0007G0029 [Candidatus Collie
MGKFLLYLSIPIILLVFLGLLFSLNKISGKSMEPTIKNGQTALFRRVFLAGEPRRSLIVLYEPEPGLVKIGRILAEPKESVRVQGGKVYIDNNAGKYEIQEEYLEKDTETHANIENTWVKMGEFNYLIVPDNRKNFVLDLEKQQINKNHITGYFTTKF